MSFWIHAALVTVFTVYFLYRFIKDKYIYELLFVLWIPSTLLTYVSDDPVFLRYLGIAQIVLFILVIYFMFRKRGQRRESTLALLAKMASDSYQPEENDSAKQDDVE